MAHRKATNKRSDATIDPLRRRRRRRLFLAGLLLVPVLAFLVFYPYGLASRLRLEMEQSDIDERIGAAQERRDSLEAAIDRLHRDTLYIERLARERFGMIRPGERVYLLDSDDVDSD